MKRAVAGPEEDGRPPLGCEGEAGSECLEEGDQLLKEGGHLSTQQAKGYKCNECDECKNECVLDHALAPLSPWAVLSPR